MSILTEWVDTHNAHGLTFVAAVPVRSTRRVDFDGFGVQAADLVGGIACVPCKEINYIYGEGSP